MVIADGPAAGTDGQGIDWSQFSRKDFPMRFRQRAGAANSLGLIKFQMQNPWNIYLHDTPGRKAFARYERHLSHGCVRVDQPTTLAANLLADTPAWSEEDIAAEIAKGRTRTIALKHPIPVYLFYWTAFMDDGALNFRSDIYKRDKAVAEALGVRPFDDDKLAGEKPAAADGMKQTAQN
jgi:murein L,D-transpeptidase YcbB/YkuD